MPSDDNAMDAANAAKRTVTLLCDAAAFLTVFGTSRIDGDALAAYSVGQQIAVVAFTLTLALLGVVFIFRFRGLRDVVHATRHEQGLRSATLRERWRRARGEGLARRHRALAPSAPGSSSAATRPDAPRRPRLAGQTGAGKQQGDPGSH